MGLVGSLGSLPCLALSLLPPVAQVPLAQIWLPLTSAPECYWFLGYDLPMGLLRETTASFSKNIHLLELLQDPIVLLRGSKGHHSIFSL